MNLVSVHGILKAFPRLLQSKSTVGNCVVVDFLLLRNWYHPGLACELPTNIKPTHCEWCVHYVMAHLHMHMFSVISHNGHFQPLKSLNPVPCLGNVGRVITLPLYAWVHANECTASVCMGAS